MTKVEQLSEDDFRLFQEFLIAETGLYFDNSHDHSLISSLYDRRLKRGHATYKEYYNFLHYHPEGRAELRELLVLITTGETYFFRNMAQFEVLMRDILPEIIRKKTAAGDRTIKIWSAGSSRGDEAYSVAIALMEVLPEYLDWKVMLQGTDINREVLSVARAGVYTPKDIGELPPEYVEKYFTRQRSEFILNSSVKSLVNFFYHNLCKDSFAQEGMQGVDIIFCRNVTIYFNLETTKALIGRFYDSLLDGGYLFLGHSETLWQINHQFKTVEYPHTFIYRKDLSASPGHSKAGAPRALSAPAAVEAPRAMISLPTVKFEDGSPALIVGHAPASLLSRDLAGVAPVVHKDMEADALLLEATYFYQNKKYVEALARLDRIITRSEGHIRGNFLKAVIYADQERYEEAVTFLERIISKSSLNLDATLLLATLKSKLGKLTEAETFFRRVIYLAANEPLAYFHLGNIYTSQKKYLKAALEFKNAIRLLEKCAPEDPVKFSEGLSCGTLLQVCKHNLAPLQAAGGG
ncbi:MAG: CheR family methyltransferase [Candidatus Omnitrophota bacterium]